MPAAQPEPIGVPEPGRDGPSARVPDAEAERLRASPLWSQIFTQGQQAARAGLTFWDAYDKTPYGSSYAHRYAFQAGWERP